MAWLTTFLLQARDLGLAHFEAAALKDAKPCALAQLVATYIYDTTHLDCPGD